MKSTLKVDVKFDVAATLWALAFIIFIFVT